MRILVVDDDAPLRAVTSFHLRRAGYETVEAESGREAWQTFQREPFPLVVTDLAMPDMTGPELIAKIRAAKLPEYTYIIVLSALDDRLTLLKAETGSADDYLVKPFAFPELLARIRSLLRRTSQAQVTRFQLGDLEFNARTRQVHRSGKAIELTLKEFDLLDYLFRNKGNIVSREMLAKDVWKEIARATPLDNVIDVHMARLRRKIDASYSHKLIHTVRGVGFMLKEGNV